MFFLYDIIIGKYVFTYVCVYLNSIKPDFQQIIISVLMCMHIHMYVFTCTHTYTHTYICKYLWIKEIHVCMYVCMSELKLNSKTPWLIKAKNFFNCSNVDYVYTYIRVNVCTCIRLHTLILYSDMHMPAIKFILLLHFSSLW